MLHAPPFRVHQDILHESPISHIRCIYLKRIQNELLKFFPRQGLFTSFSHSLVLVKFQYSAWLFFICVFQTGFCTIFTSFNVRAAQPRAPTLCTVPWCPVKSLLFPLSSAHYAQHVGYPSLSTYFRHPKWFLLCSPYHYKSSSLFPKGKKLLGNWSHHFRGLCTDPCTFRVPRVMSDFNHKTRNEWF